METLAFWFVNMTAGSNLEGGLVSTELSNWAEHNYFFENKIKIFPENKDKQLERNEGQGEDADATQSALPAHHPVTGIQSTNQCSVNLVSIGLKVSVQSSV